MSLLVRFTLFLALLCTTPSLLAFDQFEPFSENGKYGLINTETEEVIIPAEYEAIGWSDSTFRLQDNSIGIKRNGKWALTRVGGDPITPHQYTELYPYTNGLFIIAERSQFSILNTYGVISAKGKITIPLEYDRLQVADQQLIVAGLDQGRYRYGVLQSNGRWVIDESYEAISLVESGIYAVKEPQGLSAIFNSQGQQLSPFEFESIEAFDNERLLVTYYNRKGLVNKAGKAVIAPVYKEVALRNGQIRALPFRKWNSFGQPTGKPVYYFDRLMPLQNKVFAVQANENLGIISDKEAYIAYFENLKLIRAAHGLAVVSNGQYQGVIDAKGKQIMAPNYDSIIVRPNLVMGEIKRKNGQNWQLFDHNGDLISRQYYESFFEVTPERIGAVRNGKLGLLDNRGIEKTPFVYDSIGRFTDNRAVVKYQGNQGVINQDGYWLITPYKDSLALYPNFALYKQGSETGLMSYSESVLYRTQNQLRPLTPGVVAVIGESGWELADRYGTLLLNDSYDSAKTIHPDLLALFKEGKCSLFRPSQRQLINTPKHTQDLRDFAEGGVSAKIDDQWGFISEQGQLSVANRYEDVQAFSERLAAVRLIGKWGVINRQEDIIIQPTYDSIGAFYGGLALVRKEGLYGLVDREGQLVLEVQYDAIQFRKNHIILETAGLYGLADRRGGIIRTPQYDALVALGDNLFQVTKNSKQGVISLKGEDVVPVAFNQILRVGEGFLAAEPSVWIKPNGP